MPVRTTVERLLTPPVAERKYPYLGATRGRVIVYFVAAGAGVCIDGDGAGTYATHWKEEGFGYLPTAITLENELL